MSIDLELFLTVLGVGAFLLGSYLHVPALAHLKPEFRNGPLFAIFWAPQRFDARGQFLLRRAWMVQLIGLACVALAVLR